MKKLLTIMVLGLLCSGSAYANCKSDITMEVIQVNDSEVLFKFFNDGNKIIKIIDFGVSKLDRWNRVRNFRVVDVIMLNTIEENQRTLNVGWHTVKIHSPFFNCRYLDANEYNRLKKQYKYPDYKL